MVKNIEQKFAPDLAVLNNSASFLCWQDSSHLNSQTGEIVVTFFPGTVDGYC